jgi:sortase A
MMDPARELKIRPRIDDVLLTGNFRNAEAELPQSVSELKARHARPTKSASRLFFEFVQYFCLLLGLVCLGDVALYYGRAGIFQSYQRWRFDQSLRHRLPSLEPLVVRWGDRVLGAILRTPNARPQQDGAQAPAPAPPSSPPVTPSLPTGSVIGEMRIPRIGVSVMVLEGDDEGILQKAVGHVPSTALPGAIGNVAVAGHRDTFFRALKEIRQNDEITLTTTGGSYNYRVAAIGTVGPNDVNVLAPSDHPTLTLITCYPFNYIGAAPQRFIVQANETQPY